MRATILQRFAGIVLGLGLFAVPFAFAYADVSASIQSLSPSTNVQVGTPVSFSIAASGFSGPTYSITDSFSGSSVTSGNLDGNGNFSWTPTANDVGNHILTVSVQDSSGDSATVQEQIFVSNSASLSIQSLSPGSSVNAGQNITFSAAASGFSDPTYSVSDSFSGSTLTSADISNSGYFTWTPQPQDAGTHTLTITASDLVGHSASAQTSIVVVTAPAVSVQSLSPGTTVAAGSPLTFNVATVGFSSPVYSLSDSFTGSTASSADISSSGSFSWTPTAQDVGVHNFDIYVSDSSDHTATIPQQIIVQSTASVSAAASGLTSAQISAILSLLQSFGADQTTINNVSTALNGGQITASTPATANAYTFTTFLGIGSTGGAVTALQEKLAALGYLSAAPTGYFGSLTEAAVKQFQAAQGIEQAGYVGPATRAALNQ